MAFKRSLATQLAATTRPMVLVHYKTTQPQVRTWPLGTTLCLHNHSAMGALRGAATMWLWDIRHLMPTSQHPPALALTIRLLELKHSLATRPVSKTRPLVGKRSLATQPASKTRPLVPMRSLATQPASKTRPLVLMRFLATQPAPLA